MIKILDFCVCHVFRFFRKKDPAGAFDRACIHVAMNIVLYIEFLLLVFEPSFLGAWFYEIYESKFGFIVVAMFFGCILKYILMRYYGSKKRMSKLLWRYRFKKRSVFWGLFIMLSPLLWFVVFAIMAYAEWWGE